MFHQIINSPSIALTNNMCLEKEMFEKFLKLLISHGRIKSIEHLDYFGNETDFYLTFDDVYANAYDNALCWLTDNKIPFTVFIALDYLDKPNYISIEQLRKLAQNQYCTIGSHTISHPLLRFMNYEDVKNEIINSKKKLEKIIGKEIKYFAYPYGSKYACSKRVVEVAKHAGYKKAFSTFSMGINATYLRENQYFIPRINVDTCLVKKMEDYYEKTHC